MPITTANNLKINNPVGGNKSDSVLVWRGGADKIVRWVPSSEVGGVNLKADKSEIIPQSNLINYDVSVNSGDILKDGFFNAFPQLHQFNDNDVLLHYAKNSTHADYNGKRVGRISTDGGKAFGNEFIINNTIPGYNTGNVTTMVTKTNRFISLFSPVTSSNTNDGFLHIKYSDDKGQTFSPETLIPYPVGMTVCFGFGKGVNIADGKIMFGFYGSTGVFGVSGDQRNYVITSSDNGVTWSNPVLVISTDTASFKYSEAAYGYCSGSTIIGIIRNDYNNTKFVQVRSDDNGATWSTTGIVLFGDLTSDSPEIAPYYEANGDLYLSLWYVNRNVPRQIRSIVAKVDDILVNGVSAWREDKIAGLSTHVFPTSDFGYPSVINPKQKNRFLVVSYMTEALGSSTAYLRFANKTWNVSTATPLDLTLKANISSPDLTGNVRINSTSTASRFSVFNDFSVSSRVYAVQIGATRGGLLLNGSGSITQATDLLLNISTVVNPDTGAGLVNSFFRVFGNGRVIVGNGTDQGFTHDVQGTGRYSGQLTIPDGSVNTSAASVQQVNAKVVQTVSNGVTTTAPSQDATYDFVTNQTGWAQYSDNVYTVGSPLVINSGVTTALTNNGATSIITQLPTGVTGWVNTSTGKITPQNDGDFYDVEIRFKAKSSSPSGRIKVDLNIGGAMGIIREQRVEVADGVGIEQFIAVPMMVFSGSTFVANGGTVSITSLVGNTSIYDITYVVNRTHKAK